MTQATHDLERSVLSAIVTDPTVLAEVSPMLSVEDFDRPAHGRVFRAVCGLYEGGEPVTLESVAKALEDSEVLADLGGPSGLAEIVGHEATAAFAPHHARLVRMASLRRQRRTVVAGLHHAIEREDQGAPRDPRLRDKLAALDRELDRLESGRAAEPPTFRALHEGCYRLSVPAAGVTLEVDYLRRDGGQLKAELLARCNLPGARTYDGVLSVGDFNLSSTRTRTAQAKYLAERARADDLDWTGLLEELCQRTLAAERTGAPAVALRDLPRPAADEALDVTGLTLLSRHPVMIFGDGGTAKSYIGLNVAGTLARRGMRVGFFDWELCGEDHRDRLERLFGSDMPEIHYARCTRPLFYEAERLRRIVREHEIEYAVFDSVAFACDGPPEAAEVAARYFQALRQLGEIGSLHIAHISKAMEGADRKPFGSVFWANGARATWNVKLAEGEPGDRRITVGLYNRKANLGALRAAVGFELEFEGDRTDVRRVDLGDVPDLAAGLSVRQRMAAALRRGPMSREELAEAIDAKPETVKRTVTRYSRQFVVIDGGIALAEQRQ